MIGGLQFWALHHQMVDAGAMTNRQFHDAISQNGPIPVELLRVLLERRPPGARTVAARLRGPRRLRVAQSGGLLPF